MGHSFLGSEGPTNFVQERPATFMGAKLQNSCPEIRRSGVKARDVMANARKTNFT
jgi:hypothetical protein